MSFYALQRIISFAWQSFWRNIWLSLVTITIIVLTFVSINFLILVNVVSDIAIQLVKDKVDISLYFKPDITESQVLEVQTYLSSLTQVKEINYISQQEALQKFRELHQDDQAIIESLDELDENPIGATLQIKAKDIGEYQAIDDTLVNSKYNTLILDKNFEDNKTFITQIESFSNNIRKVAIITSIVFILIASLIVFNTIRVAIYTHRQEIRVMKLVGATNWFIRSPFLLEAIFYGVVSCIAAIAVVYPLLNFIQPYVNNFFLTNQFSLADYFTSNFWLIFGLELLMIIFINIVSSSIALRRYLRV